MSILIIGGTSSIAKALKSKLSKQTEVITAGRNLCNITWDISDDLEVDTFPSTIDTIIHTTANFGGETDKAILETINVNVLGTLKVCQLARQKKTNQVVLISSIYAHQNYVSAPPSAYALSKRHSEEVAQWYCKTHNIPLLILRPSQIYGTGSNFRKHQPFFYHILDKAAANEDIELYGSHNPKRNYIHIDDVATTIQMAIQKKLTGVFSCTSAHTTSYGEIAAIALQVFRSNKKIKFLIDKPDIPDNYCEIDTTLYQQLQWFPSVTLEQGIQSIASTRFNINYQGDNS